MEVKSNMGHKENSGTEESSNYSSVELGNGLMTVHITTKPGTNEGGKEGQTTTEPRDGTTLEASRSINTRKTRAVKRPKGEAQTTSSLELGSQEARMGVAVRLAKALCQEVTGFWEMGHAHIPLITFMACSNKRDMRVEEDDHDDAEEAFKACTNAKKDCIPADPPDPSKADWARLSSVDKVSEPNGWVNEWEDVVDRNLTLCVSNNQRKNENQLNAIKLKKHKKQEVHSKQILTKKVRIYINAKGVPCILGKKEESQEA